MIWGTLAQGVEVNIIKYRVYTYEILKYSVYTYEILKECI